MSALFERELAAVDSVAKWRVFEAHRWWDAHRELGLQLRFMAPEEAAGVQEVESEMRATMGRIRMNALER